MQLYQNTSKNKMGHFQLSFLSWLLEFVEWTFGKNHYRLISFVHYNQQSFPCLHTLTSITIRSCLLCSLLRCLFRRFCHKLFWTFNLLMSTALGTLWSPACYLELLCSLSNCPAVVSVLFCSVLTLVIYFSFLFFF